MHLDNIRKSGIQFASLYCMWLARCTLFSHLTVLISITELMLINFFCHAVILLKSINTATQEHLLEEATEIQE